ncbi:MAG TPA: hypothetical protein DEF02_02260, partial [Clostridiales bacterium]|nr:hypothetical protein [Clostridiales bacterium]
MGCFLVLHPNIAVLISKRNRHKKTAVRELAERTSNGHSFEAYLLTVCAHSQTEHEPQGGEEANAELDGKYK